MTKPLSPQKDVGLLHNGGSGGCIDMFLANTDQLTVLGIRVSAQCTVEETGPSLSRDFVHDSGATSPNPAASVPFSSCARPMSAHGELAIASHTSLYQRTGNAGPPSSFKDPAMKGIGGDLARRRPKSAEIGARAKEAVLELGRAARELPRGLYGLRNLSKTDLSDSRYSSVMPCSSSLDKLDDSSADADLAGQCLASTSYTSVHSILRVRRVYRWRLRGTARDKQYKCCHGGNHRSTALDCRTEVRSAHADGSDTGWERLHNSPIEYVGDTEPQQENFCTQRCPISSKSGVLFEHVSSEKDHAQVRDDTSHDFAYSENNSFSVSKAKEHNFHPMLLKVISPVQDFVDIAGHSRLAHGWRNEVVLKMRLRVGAEQSAENTPVAIHIPGSPLSSHPTSANSQLASSSGNDTTSTHRFDHPDEIEIIFLSCNSSKKLLDAIEATTKEQDQLSGPLTSQASAKLEGIEWLSVARRHVSSSSASDAIEFEWTWRTFSALFGSKTQLSSSRDYVKCACALVTIHNSNGRMHLAASFQFALDHSSVQTDGNLITVSHVDDLSGPKGKSKDVEMSSGAHSTLSDPGMADSGPQTFAKYPPPTAVSEATHLTFPSKHSSDRAVYTESLSACDLYKGDDLRNTPLCGGVYGLHKSGDVEDLLATSPEANLPSVSHDAHLKDLNHVEVSMQDVENDSPIYRAALHGLEKRTISLKRAAKAVVKAAYDLTGSLDALQVSDVQLDHTLADLTDLMPSSMNLLSSKVLLKSREEERELRRQTKTRLITNVITPVRALSDVCREVLAQLKEFEAESKTYYSATQKWLSSGARGGGSFSGNGGELYSPEAIGFNKTAAKRERLDEMQKLRQARFDLARFDVYHGVCLLHAGEVELSIASHLLAFARWQCQGDRDAFSVLQAFETVAHAELDKIKGDMEIVRARCQDLETKYVEQLSMISENESLVTSAPCDESATSENNLGQSTPSGKQAGQKFKNFLSALGGGGPLQSVTSQMTQKHMRTLLYSPIPPVEAFARRCSSNEESLVSKTEEDIRPVSVGGKWQARLRTVSFNKQVTPHDSEQQRSKGDNSHESLYNVDQTIATEMGAVSLLSRSTSVTGTEESSSKRSSQSRPATRSRGATVSDDDRRHCAAARSQNHTQSCGMMPHANCLIRPSAVPIQPTRKKEGILWVMSKPLSVIGTDDVPKAASRSNNWRESWVVLSGSGHLGEYAQWKSSKAITLEPTQPLIDLRFATVREARGLERRFVFEVVTRESRRFYQASNEEEVCDWIAAISFAIASLLDGTSSVRQVEKVARHSLVAHGALPGSDTTDSDFGMRHMFDAKAAPTSIGIHKAFTQSLTDLGTAAGGRLFQRAIGAAGREESSDTRKRDSKAAIISRGHLLVLSEGNGTKTSSTKIEVPDAKESKGNEDEGGDDEETRRSFVSPTTITHSRGISNTTPLSGYLVGARRRDAGTEPSNASDGDGADLLSSPSSNVIDEYDRRIEALVNSNYGHVTQSLQTSSSGLDGSTPSHSNSTHRVSLQNSDIALSRQTQVKGDNCNGATTSSKAARAREIMAIASRPDNRQCADCRKPDPRWASWCLHGEACCAFICITCSGIHRGLGVGVSKVRSVDLDEWTEEQLQAARRWGNTHVNAVYEARKPREQTVASMGDTRTKAFWTAKYVDRIWLDQTRTASSELEKGSKNSTLENDEKDGTLRISSGGQALRKHRPHRLELALTSIPVNTKADFNGSAEPLNRPYTYHRPLHTTPILKSASAAVSPGR